MAKIFTETLADLLGLSDPGPLVQFGLSLIAAIFWVTVVMTLVAISLVWFKRKWNARLGDRIAVNRVGPFGLLIIVADAIKLLGKEVVVPDETDRLSYKLAPPLSVAAILLGFAFVPWGSGLQIADPEAGLVLLFAFASVPAIMIVMAGYGSNNKYSFMGFEREVAQTIAYEIPLVIAAATIVPLVAFFGSGNYFGTTFFAEGVDVHPLQLTHIVQVQQGPLFGIEGMPIPNWFLFVQPFAAILFFIAMMAEVSRNPFDLPEAGSELVAGYLTEFGGVNFVLLFFTEFAHIFLANAVFVALFLGGGQGPVLPAFLWFLIKMFLLYMVNQWLRATIPRVRIDQLIEIGWKRLLELTFLNLLLTTGAVWVAVTMGLV